MKKRLELRVPEFEELGFRQSMLNDEETMAYNLGYGDVEGSGCISFPKSVWDDWYKRWIGKEPQRYSAYVIEVERGIPVGSVALRYVKGMESHCVSVVIHSKYRGLGYGEEALKLLIKVAFEEFKLERIHDEFPSTRTGAEELFDKVGFKRIDENIVELVK